MSNLSKNQYDSIIQALGKGVVPPLLRIIINDKFKYFFGAFVKKDVIARVPVLEGNKPIIQDEKALELVIIRRVSRKHGGFRYHIATKLLKFCSNVADKIEVYRSDYYVSVKKDNCFVKVFPFTVKIQTFNKIKYFNNVTKQLNFAIDASRALYGRMQYSASNSEKTVTAQSKNLIYNEEKLEFCTIIPFIPGKDLWQLYDHIQTFSLEKKLKIVIDIIIQVKLLHDKNQIHGDLKPENVVLDFIKSNIPNEQAVENLVVTLIDLDSAGTVGETTVPTCSPGFIAPENFDYGWLTGNKTLEQDIYALAGVIGFIIFGDCFVPDINVDNRLKFNAYKKVVDFDFSRVCQNYSDRVVLKHIVDYLYNNMSCNDRSQRDDIDKVLMFFNSRKQWFYRDADRARRLTF